MSWLRRIFGGNSRGVVEPKAVLDVGYRNGKRHGPYQRYRADGSLLEEGTYVDGERDGPFMMYLKDSHAEGTYRNGKLHGTYRVTRSDGTIELEKEYVDGVVIPESVRSSPKR